MLNLFNKTLIDNIIPINKPDRRRLYGIKPTPLPQKSKPLRRRPRK